MAAIPYNSSRQRIGEPIASHNDNNRQIVEKDFSPPDKVFGPRLPVASLPGWTCAYSKVFEKVEDGGWGFEPR